jgi:hypothetical protein
MESEAEHLARWFFNTALFLALIYISLYLSVVCCVRVCVCVCLCTWYQRSEDAFITDVDFFCTPDPPKHTEEERLTINVQ